jgi:predicted dithiol-disulfide oxidoreductase (DUF899 family)
MTTMDTPRVVSRQDWSAAREQLLVKEKELTRACDALAAERRRMPWVAVEKPYRFEGPDGAASLVDLFGGHLNARDTTLVFMSCAPQPDIERYRQRQWWRLHDEYAEPTTAQPG